MFRPRTRSAADSTSFATSCLSNSPVNESRWTRSRSISMSSFNLHSDRIVDLDGPEGDVVHRPLDGVTGGESAPRGRAGVQPGQEAVHAAFVGTARVPHPSSLVDD